MENMSVQHSELENTAEEVVKEHKKFAIVAVSSGEGISEAFKNLGVDEIVSGGQTMNPSSEDFINAFKECDIILTPTSPITAFPIGDKSMNENPINMYLNDVFTVSVNLAGLPAMSLPIGLSSNGLPYGMQLIGKPFDEGTIFNFAAKLEADAKFERK